MIALGVLPRVGVEPTPVDGPDVTRFARFMEGAGAESVWAVEHVVVPETYESVYPYAPDGKMGLPPTTDLPDPLAWLSYAAAATETLRLGTAMLILPEHHPVVLAKRLATLDRLSEGRLLAGVGIGWLREEYEALGVPWERRGARADEYLGAMQALWSDQPATYTGETVSFRDVHLNPSPLHDAGVPLLIGGHSKAAARRAGRFGAGLFPLGVEMERLAHLRTVMQETAVACGRDPDALSLTVSAPRNAEELEQLRTLGVERVVMSVSTDADRAAKRVERYRREVLGT